MAVKAILFFSASVLLIEAITAQCVGSQLNAGLIGLGNSYGSVGNGCGCGAGLAGNGGLNLADVAPFSGGGLSVISSSPIAPSGLAVTSENALEGALLVSGQLPFLSAVSLEGQLPTGGAASVLYSCGNGNVGIVSEGLGAGAGVAGGLGYGAGLAGAGLAGAGLGGGLGCGAGLANLGGLSGCGCNARY